MIIVDVVIVIIIIIVVVVVVSDSAGVGRTGAFIALDTAMYQIEEEEKVDIFGIVYKMRLNRVSMVQNEVKECGFKI